MTRTETSVGGDQFVDLDPHDVARGESVLEFVGNEVLGGGRRRQRVVADLTLDDVDAVEDRHRGRGVLVIPGDTRVEERVDLASADHHDRGDRDDGEQQRGDGSHGRTRTPILGA